MPTVVQFRRGTTAQNDAFTGAVGEISVDTEKDTLRVHDGSTAGGFELLQRNLTNQTIGGNVVPDTDSAYDLGSPSNKWRSLYLSGQTIYLGDATISASGTTVVLPSGSSIEGAGSVLDSASSLALLSGGTGVTYNGSGEFSIGQDVATTANVTFGTVETTGNVTVGGNLTVNGTTTTINSTTLDVDDLNITVASGAADSAAANGAGLTVDGANATITYVSATDTWDFNKAFGTGTNVISNYTTTQLTEGDNLYYTTARADSDAKAAITGGTGITYSAGTIETNDAQIVHDNLSGFVANEHIDHSQVTMTAGNGLTGGGDLTASRTFNIGAGTGITVGVDAISTNDAEIVHDNLSGYVANEHIDHTGVTLTAGAGLTGGGDISASRTFNIGQGTGITVSADTISTNDGQIVHDNLSGFVANEHIDHTGVTLTAGVGLNGGGDISASREFNIDSAELYANFAHDDFHDYVADEHVAHSSVSVVAGSGLTGGGTIAATRTLNIGQGTGITVSADAISTNDGEIVHDNLSGFVADEHIDHTTVSVTAGAGLTGGGTIAATRTLNIGQGTGITVSADAISTNDAQIVHDNLSGFVADEHVAHSDVTLTAGVGLNGGGNIASSRTFNIDSAELYANFAHDDFHDYVANEHIDHTTVSVTAGAGLTGGGTIAASRTLNIGEGTGITVSADAISTNDGEIVHDNLLGFVADEHVAHSDVTMTAGNGLTGGGTIAASRTFNVGAGTGVTVSADAVSIGQDVATTADVTFASVETTGNIVVGGNLTVNGTTTTVNTETINLADNLITLNSNETGTPSQNGGIEIERGTSTNKTLVWDETNDRWTVGSETFVAGTFLGNLTGDVTGNASTATALETARTIGLTGDVTATGVSFDGTGNITLTTAMANNSVDLGTHTTGNYVAAGATSGNGISGSVSSEGGTFTVTSNATNANTASTIVFRDASGNFSAGTITAALSGNASTATTLQTARTINGTSFNGSANITVEPYIEDDAGTNATRYLTFVDNSTAGYKRLNEDANLSYNPSTNTLTTTTFAGALSGNASTATKLATARSISLTGDVTGSTSFDGSGNVSIAATIAANSVALGTDTTGSYVQQGATAGNGLSGSVNTEAGTFTVTSNATSANTASTIVFRDASGNFSAGTITAALSGNASTASKLATARNIALTGDVTGSANFDGSGNISITATVGDDTHNHTIANVDGLQTALDGKYSTSGGTISGNVTVDAGTNTTLTVLSDDTGASGVRAYGASQGTGYLEVGQSSAYGGGISYNGDGSPAFVSGETADRVTFYRLDNGTRTEVFSYAYNSNNVEFNGTISATAGSTLVIYNSAGTALKTIKGIS